MDEAFSCEDLSTRFQATCPPGSHLLPGDADGAVRAPIWQINSNTVLIFSSCALPLAQMQTLKQEGYGTGLTWGRTQPSRDSNPKSLNFQPMAEPIDLPSAWP